MGSDDDDNVPGDRDKLYIDALEEEFQTFVKNYQCVGCYTENIMFDLPSLAKI